MSDVNLFEQQQRNRRQSRLLVAGFILFFAWLGFGGDLIIWLSEGELGGYRHGIPWLGILLTLMAAGIARYAWNTGPEKVLWATGAREVLEPQTDEERRLLNVVEEMAIASGLPRPRVWIVPELDPNAFATGRDFDTANVAVTEGLLTVLSRDELQAVIAHEMAHVKNLDVRLMTLLAALVGAIALVADGLGRIMWHSGGRIGGGGRRSSKNEGGGNPLVIALLVLWLLSWILAPIITRLLALGVSRKREFLADATAAQFTRNPLALATALEKIESAHEPTKSIKHGAAHLCIADPAGRAANERVRGPSTWFATHPPMNMRITRLRAMAYQEMKREGNFVPAG